MERRRRFEGQGLGAGCCAGGSLECRHFGRCRRYLAEAEAQGLGHGAADRCAVRSQVVRRAPELVDRWIRASGCTVVGRRVSAGQQSRGTTTLVTGLGTSNQPADTTVGTRAAFFSNLQAARPAGKLHASVYWPYIPSRGTHHIYQDAIMPPASTPNPAKQSSHRPLIRAPPTDPHLAALSPIKENDASAPIASQSLT